MTETGTLAKLCDTADVSEDLPFRAEIDGFGYAIFQAGDQYYVTADLCSHGPGYLSDGRPTKEAFLHQCMYCKRTMSGAVVHLHSTHAVAVSILDDIDPADVLPPLTAYYVMRVGTLPLIPYYPPGDEALAEAVAEKAAGSHAVLLANHGPVVAGKTLLDAQYATEELEETAKLFLPLHGRRIRPLTLAQTAALRFQTT